MRGGDELFPDDFGKTYCGSETVILQLNTLIFAMQDGVAAVAKQSKKGKKDVPVSEYPNEVKFQVYFIYYLICIFVFTYEQFLQCSNVQQTCTYDIRRYGYTSKCML